MEILGYQVNDIIYESSHSIIYRVYQEKNTKQAILKMLKES